MTCSARVRVLEAGVEFVEQPLVTPFVLSSGSIEVLTEARATVRVTTEDGEAVGRGSIYLSDLWAWPDPALSHEHRDAALRRRCERIAERMPGWLEGEPTHPLELGLRLHDAVCHPPPPEVSEAGDTSSGGSGGDSGGVPILAQAMCLSPFDAALHDAAGRALGVSAMHLYEEDENAATSADRWFDGGGGRGGGAMSAIRDMLATPVRDRLPAWWIVGKNDDLEKDVRPAYDQRGIHCFKLKLHGRDVAEDIARTVEMSRSALSWGASPRLSVDTNEACPDADFVLEYLRGLQQQDAAAFGHLDYLEQPTARDIAAHPFDWHAVAALKPVLLDEGLTSLDRLPLATEQGWSGLALKTCKGHSFALVAAAWAYQRGMTLALQDLTNPGISAVHAALLAAHLPTVNGVELNSPQFTPAANAEVAPHWPGLFDIAGGQHRLRDTTPVGLGTSP